MTSHANMQEPSPWVQRWADLAPSGTPVLDLACGGGRHGRFFLKRGHPVTFVDKNLQGVDDLSGMPKATLIDADLEDGSPWPLPRRRFGCVVVTNYLWRPILPKVIASVGKGGCLIYETFAVGNEVYGKPSNPDFLLKPDELLQAVKGRLMVRAYGHGLETDPAPAMRQHIAAVREF